MLCVWPGLRGTKNEAGQYADVTDMNAEFRLDDLGTISMAKYKTMVTPVCQQWRYCNLVLTH